MYLFKTQEKLETITARNKDCAEATIDDNGHLILREYNFGEEYDNEIKLILNGAETEAIFKLVKEIRRYTKELS